jgi:DNA-binding NtrC family response regulator
LPASLRLAVRLDQTPAPPAPRPLPLDQLLEEAERRLIRLALRLAKGNKSRAAELLAVVYPRLFRRMQALGIKE